MDGKGGDTSPNGRSSREGQRRTSISERLPTYPASLLTGPTGAYYRDFARVRRLLLDIDALVSRLEVLDATEMVAFTEEQMEGARNSLSTTSLTALTHLSTARALLRSLCDRVALDETVSDDERLEIEVQAGEWIGHARKAGERFARVSVGVGLVGSGSGGAEGQDEQGRARTPSRAGVSRGHARTPSAGRLMISQRAEEGLDSETTPFSLGTQAPPTGFPATVPASSPAPGSMPLPIPGPIPAPSLAVGSSPSPTPSTEPFKIPPSPPLPPRSHSRAQSVSPSGSSNPSVPMLPLPTLPPMPSFATFSPPPFTTAVAGSGEPTTPPPLARSNPSPPPPAPPPRMARSPSLRSPQNIFGSRDIRPPSALAGSREPPRPVSTVGGPREARPVSAVGGTPRPPSAAATRDHRTSMMAPVAGSAPAAATTTPQRSMWEWAADPRGAAGGVGVNVPVAGATAEARWARAAAGFATPVATIDAPAQSAQVEHASSETSITPPPAAETSDMRGDFRRSRASTPPAETSDTRGDFRRSTAYTSPAETADTRGDFRRSTAYTPTPPGQVRSLKNLYKAYEELVQMVEGAEGIQPTMLAPAADPSPPRPSMDPESEWAPSHRRTSSSQRAEQGLVTGYAHPVVNRQPFQYQLHQQPSQQARKSRALSPNPVVSAWDAFDYRASVAAAAGWREVGDEENAPGVGAGSGVGPKTVPVAERWQIDDRIVEPPPLRRAGWRRVGVILAVLLAFAVIGFILWLVFRK
ncbi:hypothetical protein M427DRAFT_157082 [Gonapodya prolifera JEL478]|uniref:Uncharacterized protein n=1 Tax=Gonapodya prolifera (strain JEL478) TaxID=1344416 RepID=A0A139A888_GONPJ|nr:hypothetical protein M427DRAFT_157082 [Gonapodya prolifera JEL478]|eukprot:KXS12898.1 hypothetical protein M427DRAFT_157082 [Gonapodya prolifera JEL478]